MTEQVAAVLTSGPLPVPLLVMLVMLLILPVLGTGCNVELVVPLVVAVGADPFPPEKPSSDDKSDSISP